MKKTFTWEPDYACYDVCECGHAFCEHDYKKTEKCYNSCTWDVETETVIRRYPCLCLKFKFQHSEIMRKLK